MGRHCPCLRGKVHAGDVKPRTAPRLLVPCPVSRQTYGDSRRHTDGRRGHVAGELRRAQHGGRVEADARVTACFRSPSPALGPSAAQP